MLPFITKLWRVTLLPATNIPIAKLVPLLRLRFAAKFNAVRTFADDSRDSFIKSLRRRKEGVKEKLMAPSDGSVHVMGKGALLAGSCLGLGALCFYGLGLSDEPGVLEQSQLWPKMVRDRIRATYIYFGGSVLLTAFGTVATFRSPLMLQFVMENSLMSLAVLSIALLGSGLLVQSIPYQKGLGMKQLAWVAHAVITGCTIAPICFLGGPIIMQAAWYTAGIVTALSALAVCAPSETFITLGGPLAIGLGLIFASSIGSTLLPPTTNLGAGLYSVNLYGGLLLFSAFLLYDTQRIIKRAEEYPVDTAYPYDPINESISIYLDTVNLFIRILTMVATGSANENKKKK